jgi:hypothetical protein
MPIVRDFRRYLYQPARVDRCGRDVAKVGYWKLYSLENTFRVVINSVLLSQIGQNWWMTGVDPNTVRKAQTRRARYTARPRHANPGPHDIYLVDLFDLIDILRVNNHLFLPIIPETNQWLATLESVRFSRNLVGHMNFPNAYDRQVIDSAYQQLPSLMGRLSASNVPIVIP